MQSIIENTALARLVGVIGVIGHVAAAFVYILLPALTVPFPAFYAFFAAWVIVLLASIWWLRRHPWRSLVVVLIGFALAVGALILGERLLGWTA